MTSYTHADMQHFINLFKLDLDLHEDVGLVCNTLPLLAAWCEYTPWQWPYLR